MTIEIIAIGHEVLHGVINNTNASFISAELLKAGWNVKRHTVLPDDAQSLEEGIREALARADMVITTGGLGPTCDDLTRSIASKIFDSPIQRDEELVKELTSRYGEKLTSLEDQSLAPTKAKRLTNRLGTASGWVFSENGRRLALLPGPPREMSAMLIDVLLPQLSSIIGQQPRQNFIQVSQLCCLREDDVDPFLRKLSQEFPSVHAGIYPGYGSLTVRFSSPSEQETESCQQALEREFGTYLFYSPHGKIEESIHSWFKEHEQTLAFAESCTGGRLASQITLLPGASEFFLGSLIVYADQLKRDLLGVAESTISSLGAVSKEVVEEMLEGLFKKTQADWALAVSGIAGPTGGSHEKPVGTVWCAMGQRGHPPETALLYFPFSRETIITVTSTYLLGALWRKIRYRVPLNSGLAK